VFFKRHAQSLQVDALTRKLAEDLRWSAQGRAAVVWLYAEVDAATLNGVTVILWQDGRILTRALRSQSQALVRNLWSEFRLNGRENWRALVVRDAGDGTTSTAYIYDDNFDNLAGYEKRLRRWIARTVPAAPITPVEIDE
jgi:hypothetical protein